MVHARKVTCKSGSLWQTSISNGSKLIIRQLMMPFRPCLHDCWSFMGVHDIPWQYITVKGAFLRYQTQKHNLHMNTLHWRMCVECERHYPFLSSIGDLVYDMTLPLWHTSLEFYAISAIIVYYYQLTYIVYQVIYHFIMIPCFA